MCLVIERRTKRQKATENIVCYKQLIIFDIKLPAYEIKSKEQAEKALFKKTTFRRTCANMNTLHKTKLRRFQNTIEHGFHSFCTLEDVKESETLTFKDEFITKCIIPKGAYYYKGLFSFRGAVVDNYASSQIIYQEVTHKIGDNKELIELK